MKKTQACPVCDSKKKTVLFSKERFPYFTAPVSKIDKAGILKKYSLKKLEAQLSTAVCLNCSHIYLRALPDEKIMSGLYSDYYSYPSAMLGGFIPERDNEFLRLFKIRISRLLGKGPKKILEIGCYDGYILYALKKQGHKVCGCDPSAGADIGKKFGLDIRKQFFNAGAFLKKGGKFDAVIFRHLLEHTKRPAEFLSGVKKILNEGGKIIFEVPNSAYCLKNGSPAVFSLQHLQYFSAASIKELAVRCGLKIVSLTDSGENLLAVCSPGNEKKEINAKPVIALSRAFAGRLKAMKKKVGGLFKAYKDKGIILWGAGGFGGSAIEMFDIPAKQLICIVDSDKNKNGMEYLKCGVAVRGIEELNKHRGACVFICSMYSRQIASQLRKLRYPGAVIDLYPRVKVVREGRDA